MPQYNSVDIDIKYDYLIKIIIVGDSNVGKSALLMRYINDIFEDTYMSTIGVDFRIKTLKYDNKLVKLQIWDTAGQERFKSITSIYYANADAVIYVFSLNDPDTFSNIEMWMNEVNTYVRNRQPRIILVGTKADLPHMISPEQIDMFCDKHNIIYIETSSKTGHDVAKPFEELSNMLIAGQIKHRAKPSTFKSLNTSNTLNIYPNTGSSYFCC